jgi:hypothetical protein
MTKIKICDVHIDTIKVGDIICSDGLERTVGKNNIKRSSFMGVSIFGDTYNLGTKKVKKVVYEKN